VIVDDRVDDVVAETAPLLLGRAGAVAGNGMAGLGEARERCPIDVQQIAGAGPLVATSRLARLRLWPRAAAAAERLPDGRVRTAEPGGDRPRAVPGAAPLGTDPRLQAR